MATFIEALPATKSSTTNTIRFTPSATAMGGLLTIDTKRSRAEYLLAEFHATNGRAFHFAKLTSGTDPESESYTVLCVKPGHGYDSCECRGFHRHGHCKHVEAVKAILENGWM
jgi:hypothetical protein